MNRLTIFGYIVATAPAFAQGQSGMRCEDSYALRDFLFSAYGEAVQVEGLMPDGALAQWYANVETGSWSLVRVDPTGVSCIAAFGDGHTEVYDTVKPGEPG